MGGGQVVPAGGVADVDAGAAVAWTAGGFLCLTLPTARGVVA